MKREEQGSVLPSIIADCLDPAVAAPVRSQITTEMFFIRFKKTKFVNGGFSKVRVLIRFFILAILMGARFICVFLH